MHEASTEVGHRRPALRRPKIENVEAAEAAKEAAIRAGAAVSLGQKSSSRNSSSPTTILEPKESAQNEAAINLSNQKAALSSHSSSSSSINLEPAVNEFSDLRCSSVRTEEIVEREKARQERREKRCPDYPGLAFGAPLGFGSDTMMKFNIIKNELHNIMRSQLKRVDGEATALATRIKEFDANLEKSEQLIKTATLALAETVELEMERKRIKKENNEDDSDCDESDPLRQFDAQMALLEGKLVQAKQLASQDHIISLPAVLERKHKDPLTSDVSENKDEKVIANTTQTKSSADLRSPASSLLVNGDHNELNKDSCHIITHKEDQETSW